MVVAEADLSQDLVRKILEAELAVGDECEVLTRAMVASEASVDMAVLTKVYYI